MVPVQVLSRWGERVLVLPTLPSSRILSLTFIFKLFVSKFLSCANVEAAGSREIAGCPNTHVLGGGIEPVPSPNPHQSFALVILSAPHGKMEGAFKPWEAGPLRHLDLVVKRNNLLLMCLRGSLFPEFLRVSCVLLGLSILLLKWTGQCCPKERHTQ